MHNFTNNLIPPGLSGDRQSVFHCTACGHGFIATAKAAGIFSPLGGTPKCPKCGSRKTIENSNALKGITMNELARKNTMPEKGDILMIDRGIYKHFGIYSGEQTVIHYADKSGDWGGNICIQKIPLSEFVKGATVTVCKIPQSYRRNHTVYSPEETVRRARSRLGEREYNLVTNNCEHFALWCKTGVSTSEQVTTVLSVLAGGALAIAGIKKIADALDSEEPADVILGTLSLAGAAGIAIVNALSDSPTTETKGTIKSGYKSF